MTREMPQREAECKEEECLPENRKQKPTFPHPSFPFAPNVRHTHEGEEEQEEEAGSYLVSNKVWKMDSR